LGRHLGEIVQPGDVILLVGNLGAGKTCFTQGIAWGLGVEEYAFSPSFVLVREYKGRLTMFHIDFYRLEQEEEVASLGLDDYLFGQGVCVVEWADRVPNALTPEHLLVKIGYLSETERTLDFKATGERYREVLQHLKSRVQPS
jgi:tRNA threonylcarbamoyladenosine biosynthesis protein TsaE